MSDDGIVNRVTRQGEEAIGKLAQELLENPMVSGALARAFEARERATRAQELAMGALNLPSASDLERLTRRVRSVSQRLEGIEDGLDRLDDRLQRPAAGNSLEGRLTSIERTLERLEAAQSAATADAATAAAAAAATVAAPATAATQTTPATQATPAQRDKPAAKQRSKPAAKREPGAAGANARARKPSS